MTIARSSFYTSLMPLQRLLLFSLSYLVYDVSCARYQDLLSPSSFVAVSLLAGSQEVGNQEGTGTEARLSITTGQMVVHPRTGYVYACDDVSFNVKEITTDGTVSIIAGSPTAQAGSRNGLGIDALFYDVKGIDLNPETNVLYIAVDDTVRTISMNNDCFVESILDGGGYAYGLALSADYEVLYYIQRVDTLYHVKGLHLPTGQTVHAATQTDVAIFGIARAPTSGAEYFLVTGEHLIFRFDTTNGLTHFAAQHMV
eukprot:TRINITY_DN2183_c1_g1_i7.p2 TRINITY_DN2183_c1_g1~~TRINITY_DN2183_c1_g1_i7.p2  ORF type:complete len:256 (-),score=38.12 TRINITY_DN2183_c1_g1_i7:1185-1952(-)